MRGMEFSAYKHYKGTGKDRIQLTVRWGKGSAAGSRSALISDLTPTRAKELAAFLIEIADQPTSKSCCLERTVR